MISRISHPNPCPAAGLALLLLLGAGCVRYQAQPINPEKTAAALTDRSLSDAGLRAYLAENLGHEPVPWPPPTWDLDALTWAAFYYQPALEVARAQWDAARAAMRTAGARPNPVLTVTPGYDTSVSGAISPWFPSVGLDFLVETGGRRARRMDAARLDADAARLDVVAAAWAVRSELRQALIAASTTEQKAALLDKLVGLRRDVATLLDQRLRAGEVSAFEASTANQALLRAEASAAEVRRQIPLARIRVARAIGVSAAALDGVQLEDLAAAPRPPVAGDALAAARHQALLARSDVLGALARYEASQEALRLEVARQYPDLRVGPGYQYDLGENKWSLALGVELPIFARNRGPIGEAEARRREAAAQFLATQARALAEIEAAAAAQTAALDQVAQVRKVNVEIQQHAALVQARLAAGEGDQLEVGSADTELAEAGLAALDARSAAATAAGQLEDALQVPLRNLTAVVNAVPAGGTSTSR